VLINQKTNFGNVLPQTTRRFEFSWSGEESPLDIGLYSAVVTLGYGEDSKQNTSATTYFWVVPIVPVSITLAIFIAFIALITWFIRRYIRRALMIERQRFGVMADTPQMQHTPTLQTFIAPIKQGVVDLRSVGRAPEAVAQASEMPSEKASAKAQYIERAPYLTFGDFVRNYYLFLLFVVVIICALLGLWWYFSSALKAQKTFQITDVKMQVEDLPQKQ
jgi:hypothetical protein